MKKPKVIFLLGPPGSGKTKTSEDLIPSYLPILNIDNEYTDLLIKTKVGLNIAEMSSDELSIAAKSLAHAHKNNKEQIEYCFEWRKDFVYDGTGAAYKPIEKLINRAKEQGYDILCVFCWATPITCVKRNYNRERKLKHSIVTRGWRDCNQNYLKYKELLGENNVLTVCNDFNQSLQELMQAKYFNIDDIATKYPFKSSGKIYTPEETKKNEGERRQISFDIMSMYMKWIWNFDSNIYIKQRIIEFLK